MLSRVVMDWILERTQILAKAALHGANDVLSGKAFGTSPDRRQNYGDYPGQPASPPMVMPWQLLRQKITNDPYYRFQSLSEIRIAAEHGIRIDVNTASLDDWLRLPGLSIHQARLLTQLTESGVQFYCVEDVAAALGTSMQRLKPVRVPVAIGSVATD
jgi:hypothetical protein